MRKYGLNEQQAAAIRARTLQLTAAGDNATTWPSLRASSKSDMQDIGAQQIGHDQRRIQGYRGGLD